jgi:hypothetical protein
VTTRLPKYTRRVPAEVLAAAREVLDSGEPHDSDTLREAIRQRLGMDAVYRGDVAHAIYQLYKSYPNLSFGCLIPPSGMRLRPEHRKRRTYRRHTATL